MTTPLLELEGTWAEITAQIPNFAGQKLRVLVYPVKKTAPQHTIPVPLQRSWRRLPRPSLPQSLPSYRQTSPTNWTTISTVRLNDEAGLCGYVILGGQYYARRPWYASTLRAVAAWGRCILVTTEEVLVEFLSAYAGRGVYLRQSLKDRPSHPG